MRNSPLWCKSYEEGFSLETETKVDAYFEGKMLQTYFEVFYILFPFNMGEYWRVSFHWKD